MKCPVDKIPLKAVYVNEIELNVCPKCLGIWFDSHEFYKVADEFARGKSLEEYGLAMFSDPAKKKKGVRHGHDTILYCPKDYSEMKEFQYAGDSKIFIHRCQKCKGIWFDGEEVMHLVEYIKPNPTKEALAKELFHCANKPEYTRKALDNKLSKMALNTIFKFGYPSNVLAYLVFVAGDIIHKEGKKKGLVPDFSDPFVMFPFFILVILVIFLVEILS